MLRHLTSAQQVALKSRWSCSWCLSQMQFEHHQSGIYQGKSVVAWLELSFNIWGESCFSPSSTCIADKVNFSTGTVSTQGCNHPHHFLRHLEVCYSFLKDRAGFPVSFPSLLSSVLFGSFLQIWAADPCAMGLMSRVFSLLAFQPVKHLIL